MISPFPIPPIPYTPQQIAVDGGYVANWCRTAQWGHDWQPAPLGSRILHVGWQLRSQFPNAHILWAWDMPQWLTKGKRIPRLNQALRLMGISCFGDYDDAAKNIIASSRVCAPGLILTDNNTIHSLVEDQLYAVSYGLNEWKIHSPEQLQSEWKVPPYLIPDLLALAGDVANSIPGIPGISLGYAQKTMQRFKCPLEELDWTHPSVEELQPFRDQLLDNRFYIAPQRTASIRWDPLHCVSIANIHREAMENGFSVQGIYT